MSNNLTGVYLSIRKDGSPYYRSSITYKNKHISLGSYTTMLEAHLAYLEAKSLIDNDTLTISSYNDNYHFSLNKWVSIINYRDNGIYFQTPIYLRKMYFEYYLDLDYILKFDIDDLFYYSSKKIMKRNNHLFVADYGMQVTIASRYGIKSYAVEGRDYLHINGDNLDYRYSNINILNAYHGVYTIRSGITTRYKTKILINGNYIVGTYDTIQEAAIAHNKAADILIKKGINKGFLTNYIEGISPQEYANIYHNINISPAILNYEICHST